MQKHNGPPLYLKKLTIKNVRCFEKLTINLDAGGKPRMWGVVFGDNGVGKTTLLRCIAIGLCDEASAAGLLREIYGEWNRSIGEKLKKGEIILEFHSDKGVSPTIITEIIPHLSGYSQIKRTVNFGRHKKDLIWDRIFACGYGSARRAFGSRDIEDYATIDSVYTLFNYDTPLQNPELVLRRLIGPTDDLGRSKRRKRINDARKRAVGPLLDSLAEVLTLPKGSVQLTRTGLKASGPWGDFQPIGGLGDGYQATLAWLTDMLGWAMLYDPDQPIEQVRGIILIDEIEQHLHPRWQRQIIKLLRDHFPYLQFIATTHTPMCAIGTTDLPDGECELIKLERNEGSVRAIENITPPRNKRADQVLTSFLFELPTAGDNETVGDIARYNQLKIRTRLTVLEKKEAAVLHAKLRKEFGEAQSEFEDAIQTQVRKALRIGYSKVVNMEAAKFEIARQLREIASNEKD